ncbi:hypothetical protein [Aneurinibacillus terranovensis]|uniref:hypothetical protein n=1 Tax=Aneurinibacillus terranovensis TaxID=278991 RepID=UPI00041E6FDA|nr:hypothetical protein [Aneurinibacillus terranovensis]
MTTRDKKAHLCRTHRTLLKLVFHMGKGVMYKQHILRYMSLFEGSHEIDTSKALGELKDNEILDYHSFFGAKVIKLNKYAVYFLLQKEREDVSSISLTAGKVKKSAFLNQIILQNADRLKKKSPSLQQLIPRYLNDTTYFTKDKESFVYLQRQYEQGWCSSYAEHEIQRLILAKQQGHQFENTSADKIQNDYNLNSIQASNIYLGLKRKLKTGETFLLVDVLDINGLITAKKFAEKVNLTTDHLKLLFDQDKLNFEFRLYVQSPERQEFLLKHARQISVSIQDHCKEEIRWIVKNLDLEATLFRNQKILLNV